MSCVKSTVYTVADKRHLEGLPLGFASCRSRLCLGRHCLFYFSSIWEVNTMAGICSTLKSRRHCLSENKKEVIALTFRGVTVFLGKSKGIYALHPTHKGVTIVQKITMPLAMRVKISFYWVQRHCLWCKRLGRPCTNPKWQHVWQKMQWLLEKKHCIWEKIDSLWQKGYCLRQKR